MKKVHHAAKRAAKRVIALPLYGRLFIIGLMVLVLGWAVELSVLFQVYALVGDCVSPCNNLSVEDQLTRIQTISRAGIAMTYIGFAILLAGFVHLILTAHKAARTGKK